MIRHVLALFALCVLAAKPFIAATWFDVCYRSTQVISRFKLPPLLSVEGPAYAQLQRDMAVLGEPGVCLAAVPLPGVSVYVHTHMQHTHAFLALQACALSLPLGWLPIPSYC
jgi:hypothetical protein